MRIVRYLALAAAISMPYGIAAANNDDGFVWIDANTRIKVKPVGTVTDAVKPAGTAASGGTAAEKVEEAPRKAEKKEKPRK